MKQKKYLFFLVCIAFIIPVYFVTNLVVLHTKTAVSAANGPDIDVTYIQRLPTYNYDATKNLPAAGDTITWVTHIKNAGDTATGVFSYTLSIDGTPIKTGTTPSLNAGQEVQISQTWVWQSDSHTIKFVADPNNLITEISKTNNTIEEQTNGLAVGFWVEQSFYNWFNTNQILLGIGSDSFEDFIRRQMTKWNDILAISTYPDLPKPILDRIRIDKFTVVPDGTLPSKEHPAVDDHTIDMEWGFPSNLLNTGFYETNGQPKTALTDDNPFYLEYSLPHEMSHARYLIDWYALDINSQYASTADQVQVLKKDGTQVIPKGLSYVYFCEGAMMGCDNVHPDKAHVYAKDDVFAWDFKAGMRAKCGNYNAPCDLGSFLLNIPAKNYIQVNDINNIPVANATVSIYQTVPNPASGLVYDKLIDNIADATCVTDSTGKCDIGSSPFGNLAAGDPDIRGMAILKIQKNGEEDFKYFYIPQANLSYWINGNQTATYSFSADLRTYDQGDIALHKTVTTNMPDPTTAQSAQVVDGDTLTSNNGYTVYSANAGDWTQVDFGSPFNVGKAIISKEYYYWLCPYHIELSLTGSFAGEQIKYQATDFNAFDTFIFPPTPARYLRVVCDSPGNYYLHEIQAYAVSGGILPTPSPTSPSQPTGVTGTAVSLNVFLHGLGAGGDNPNPAGGGNMSPQHTTKNITVSLIGSNQQTMTQQGQITYDTVSKSWRGTVSFANTSSGNYTIKVKTVGFLQTQISGIFTITTGQTTATTPIYEVTGDINNDNQIDILDYNLLISCYGSKQNTPMCTMPPNSQSAGADISDDGIINGGDYNLFLRELSTQKGL